jgi:hypothetical protein
MPPAIGNTFDASFSGFAGIKRQSGKDWRVGKS